MIGNDDDQLVGGKKQRERMMPMPVTVTGVSCVSTLWLIATFLILAGLVIAGGFPNWFRNRVDSAPQSRDLANNLRSVDLGLYYLCYSLMACPDTTTCAGECRDVKLCGCYTYMSYSPPSTITTTSGGEMITRDTNMRPTESIGDFVFLFSGSIVYAFACFLLLISLLVGIIAYCKPRCGACSLFLFAFVLQAVAGIALIVALALLPVFFGSNFAEQFCGQGADYYNRGQCSLDWSLFLAMVVTACSLYLPALAIFAMNISDGLNAHVCC